jgi:hypothetical protein
VLILTLRFLVKGRGEIEHTQRVESTVFILRLPKGSNMKIFLATLLMTLSSTVILAAGRDFGTGGDVLEPTARFIVEAEELPQLLARPGALLIAAASEDETGPLGYVDHAVLVDEDAWANFSFSADDLVDYPTWSWMIGQLGIGASTRVFVYDDGELKFAHAFVFFSLIMV